MKLKRKNEEDLFRKVFKNSQKCFNRFKNVHRRKPSITLNVSGNLSTKRLKSIYWVSQYRNGGGRQNRVRLKGR